MGRSHWPTPALLQIYVNRSERINSSFRQSGYAVATGNIGWHRRNFRSRFAHFVPDDRKRLRFDVCDDETRTSFVNEFAIAGRSRWGRR
jgi:hypothetical protein